MGVHNTVGRPGVLHFFAGYGPAAPLGPCLHACDHRHRSVIAHGPDWNHYELMTCDVEDGCDGQCRCWSVVAHMEDPGRVYRWTHVGPQTPMPKHDRDIVLDGGDRG